MPASELPTNETAEDYEAGESDRENARRRPPNAWRFDDCPKQETETRNRQQRTPGIGSINIWVL